MRRTLLFTLLASLLSGIAGPARAECDCLWQGSFADVEAQTDLVVSATVVAASGNSVDLEIDRLLRGEPPVGPLRVWLAYGDYCRPQPSRFPVGSTWVMALDRISEEVPDGFNPHTPNVSYGRLGDFSLSKCGGYWLRRSGDLVSGNLVDATRWDHDPQMSPVLLDLVAGYVEGRLGREVLLEASRENPALRELRLETRAFLRNEN